MSELLYLYAIVPASSPAVKLLEQRRLEGLSAGEPLFPLAAGALVAAVSRVSEEVFGDEALNGLLSDLAALAPYAWRHEEAVSALRTSAPALLPMAFGAIFRGQERVSTLLQERSGELIRLLERLEGKEEWGLKVYLEAERLARQAERSSQEIGRLGREASEATPGHAYFLAKRRERLVSEEAARLARSWGETILAELTKLAVEVHREERLPAERGELPLLVKAAFLVEAAQAERFRRAAVRLSRRHGPRGLRLEVTGPWAPYSFVASVDGWGRG